MLTKRSWMIIMKNYVMQQFTNYNVMSQWGRLFFSPFLLMKCCAICVGGMMQFDSNVEGLRMENFPWKVHGLMDCESMRSWMFANALHVDGNLLSASHFALLIFPSFSENQEFSFFHPPPVIYLGSWAF